MTIFQFVHTLNYGDAISGEALAIHRLLDEQKVENEIFSVHAHQLVAKERQDWRRFQECYDAARERGEDVGVLLHYSIGSPLNDLFGELTDARRGIIYHNLTPVRWFRGYNPRVVIDLEKGRSELPSLLRHADVVLADSQYNLDELSDFGCKSGEVLPLMLDSHKWQVAANPGIARALTGHGGKNILHVGRLAPNKRIEDIIKSFYFYHHKINRDSRLWLVGTDIDTEMYSFELRSMVSELRLKEAVTFVGAVSDGELRAFYENADAYICMSEHEGFCVPLLEAMHFGVPVIAYDACAVKETLADAGLLLAKKDPARVAELINIVIEDAALSEDLVARGKRRVEDFSLDTFARHLRERVLGSLIPGEQVPDSKAVGAGAARERG